MSLFKQARSKEQIPKQGGGGNVHKSNWLTILKAYLKTLDDLTKAAGDGDLAAILVDTAAVQTSLAEGGFTDLLIDAIKAETALIVADTNEVQVSLANGGFTDLLIDAIKAETALIVADTGELQTDWANGGRLDAILDLCALEATLTAIKGVGWTDQNLTTMDALLDDIKGYLDTEVAAILADTGELQTDWADGGRLDLLLDACALEATLTAIKGAGWTNETLKAIKDAIDVIGGVNTYQEQIPDTDFALAAIDDEPLLADPPTADAENSVVDIDANAGDTFVLRSLIVNVTSFGTTGGTKLTFSLWVPVNGAITKVDSVDVAALGFQNLMDLFGLPEVHGDSIHITVVTDATDTPGDAACSGTYKYAKAS